MKHFIQTFGQPAAVLMLLLFGGSFGYHLLEDWDFLDSIYMTLITITTVGFGEVRPLDAPGKLFTIFLLMGGVLFYALTINSITKNLESIVSEHSSKRPVINKDALLEDALIDAGIHSFKNAAGRRE